MSTLNNQTNFEDVYSNMIAGQVAGFSGDVEKSIFYIARSLLDTEHIHFAFGKSRDGKTHYYLAQASAKFSSIPYFETALTVAFPDHPQHQGDGAYFLEGGAISSVLFKDGARFSLLTNTTSEIIKAVEDSGLPVINVEKFSPLPMQSVSGRLRLIADKISSITLKVSVAIIGIGFAVGVGANIGTAYYSNKLQTSSAQDATELNLLLTKIDHASPLSAQLAQFQKTSSVVVRAGGWIDTYNLEKDVVSFQVSLPEWVTNDFIEALGKNAIADHDIKNNLIKVKSNVKPN